MKLRRQQPTELFENYKKHTKDTQALLRALKRLPADEVTAGATAIVSFAAMLEPEKNAALVASTDFAPPTSLNHYPTSNGITKNGLSNESTCAKRR
jgi:hypothetical protein